MRIWTGGTEGLSSRYSVSFVASAKALMIRAVIHDGFPEVNPGLDETGPCKRRRTIT